MDKTRYKKILNLIDKDKYSKFDLITNYGLFSGSTNLYKTLKIYELILSIEKVKGDIIEFGTHRGNTGILIAKILKLRNIKKKVFLFDSFEGLQNFNKKDNLKKKFFKGIYKGNFKKIKKLIKFFKLDNIEIIKKDATNISNDFFNNKIYSLMIFDMDLYEPTINVLDKINIKKNLVKYSKIVFDEGNSIYWKGEKRALNEFLNKNKKKFTKKIISKKLYQPDVELTKK